MKKKQDKSDGLTLEFLERKYQQEKQILTKQNKRLSEQLMAEAERGNLLMRQIKKMDLQNQSYQHLLSENQQLKAEIENLGRMHESSFLTNQEQEVKLLTEHKKLAEENNELTEQKRQLQNIIQIIYQEKQKIQSDFKTYKLNERELRAQMEEIAIKHNKFKAQSNSQIEQLQQSNKSMLEENRRLNQKLAEQKQKKKQLQKILTQLEKRVSEADQIQQSRIQQQLQSLKSERDRYHQKNIELQTKVALLTANCTQKQQFISKLEAQLKQEQRKKEGLLDQAQDLRAKLQKREGEIIRLEEEFSKLKQEQQEFENQKSTVGKDDFLRQMKKNLTQFNDMSQKNLQRFAEGPTIRDHPQSQSNEEHHYFLKQEEGSLQRVKFETQINNLTYELSQCKKQQQALNYELRSAKRQNQQRQHELDRKQAEIRQFRLKIDKIQNQKNKELLPLRRQNQLLRGKQTEMLQKVKQFNQYETSISLKLAFYERKIKEHLDTIDRKENLIEKHKFNLSEYQSREHQNEESLKRLTDQIEVLRSFKQECSRKQNLTKEYKSKIEKIKEEKEDLTKDNSKMKADITKLKNDKQRLQTQLQIKQRQLISLRSKQQKSTTDKNEEYFRQHNKLKQNKNISDAKIKQLKKQKDELVEALQEIRSSVLNKVQQYLAKQIPTGKKKVYEYEAAKVLGLKSVQLEQFLNPSSATNRKISKQLDELWEDGNFRQFMNSFVNYLLLQNETQ